MRKYQKVWEKLKAEFKCNVEVHHLIAARVIKAVIKEKYSDAAFKMANPDDKLVLDIKRKALGGTKLVRVEFRLRQRYGLADVNREINL